MKNFEYAHPSTEADAVDLLTAPNMSTAVLAGGTDLVGLMKRMVVRPDRVVNISDIDSLRSIERDSFNNTWVGAAVHLDEFLQEPMCDPYPAVKRVIQAISSVQLQSQGTLVGEILRRPCCWYFRDGHDLLADRGRMVVEGDNRYHAILGNRGPAKFVSASRLAPALISLGAKVRVIGPAADEKQTEEQFIDLESLYQIPREASEQETTLAPGQLVTHVIIPPDNGRLSAAYEVRHGAGPDQPLTAAAVSLEVRLDTVRDARIVLGQVAPTPWIATDAARVLRGRPISEESADAAGAEAVAGAMPLSQNQYKVELTQVAVKRAILRAAGLDTGGF